MLTLKPIARIFTASLVIFSLLAFTFSGVTQAQAQTQPPEATPADGADASDGLSDADWEQINAILPAAVTSQQAYIKASNTETGDNFGSIAISGNIVAIGAPGEDSNATGVNGDQTNNLAVDSGAVYVFVRNGDSWSQQAYLKASNTDAGDEFGASVAISGDTIVVGAPSESSNATGVNGDQTNNSAQYSGAAYVFTRTGGVWSQQAYLKASNAGVNDAFGSVKIDADTIVVGAAREASNATGVNGNQADNSAGYSGAAYVFTRSGSVWAQQAYLKASNTDPADAFGGSLRIAGDTIAVGAPFEDSHATGVNGDQADNSKPNAGAVYVFTRNANLWSQQAYIKASNPNGNDLFGAGLAISGNTLVVGAPRESSNATGVNGNQSDNSATDSGAAYVFTRSGMTWSQQAYIKASNTNADDRFGGVAISGNILVVGASSESSNATGVNGNQADNSARSSGAVYIFTRSGSTWSQQAYLKASNTEAVDGFGGAAIAGDIIVVNAYGEDSNATGINGDQANNSATGSGAVYAFSLALPSVLASQRTSLNPTTAATVNYKVTFSEPVTGVDVSDFGLAHTSALSGAAITGVSGGPAAYTVTVNTGTGNGMLRLNLYDNDSIINAYGIPLGGAAGMSNGNFITGETYLVRPVTQTFQSQAALDGWLLESSENSNVGGAMDSAAALLYLGDDAANKQIRALLHFETGSLPDTAVITAATLKLVSHSLVGSNPFSTHGNLRAEVFKPYFGAAAALQVSDFEISPAAALAGLFNPTPVGAIYSAVLTSTGRTNINLTGSTQFRLRFAVDDNNNLTADYMRFYSGNALAASNQPALVVQYYVP